MVGEYLAKTPPCTLVKWALDEVSFWASKPDPEQQPAQQPEHPPPPEWLRPYGQVLDLNWGQPGQASDDLTPIFDIIPRADGHAASPEPARELDIERLVDDERSILDRRALAEKLRDAWTKLQAPDDLETFGHLLNRYAWMIPCTYGAVGVSLYEEFKALVALIHASPAADGTLGGGPAAQFTLVGGDLPGIQGFVYTITSRGAAKSLRGRSFFLQILSDALVRSLVNALGLCWANVVYDAGGNFCVFAQDGIKDDLDKWCLGVNRKLLHHFGGDLSLALASQSLDRDQVGNKGFAKARTALGQAVAIAKKQAFRDIMAQGEAGWQALFGAKGQGGDQVCCVCGRSPAEGETFREDTERATDSRHHCAHCDSFGKLAEDIAHDTLWMVVDTEPIEPSDQEQSDETQAPGPWSDILQDLSGLTYRFAHKELPRRRAKRSVLRINQESVYASGWGFRYFANLTPTHMVPSEDGKQLVRQIKDFEQMAQASHGIERVGVLRMDVDGLGTIFGERFDGSLPQLSALSAAMDRFFGGYLNVLCTKAEEAPDVEPTLYTIYAGGDDLFIVGAWDRMPALANEIQSAFRRYTHDHPLFTLSGGVTLEGAHFPLYRAASRSQEAEGAAKGYVRANGRKKDAFSFLGRTVGWEDWSDLGFCLETLQALVAKGVPSSLLHLQQSMYSIWHGAQGEDDTGIQIWGRWNWMAAYALTRLARGHDESVKRDLLMIQSDWVASETRIARWATASRWVELLERE